MPDKFFVKPHAKFRNRNKFTKKEWVKNKKGEVNLLKFVVKTSATFYP